jgi:hypothetical protein
VFVIRHFGVKKAEEFLTLYGADVMTTDPESSKLTEPYQSVLAERERLYQQYRFFHWDLEFPEVFIDLDRAAWKENAGFDAVVGNPPYLNAWTMTKEMPVIREVLLTTADSFGVLKGHWDLFMAFVVRSFDLTKQNGLHSFIVPNPILREKYAVELRDHILREYRLKRILSFGEVNVFDEVSRQCVIYVLNKQHPDEDSRTTINIAYGIDRLWTNQKKLA